MSTFPKSRKKRRNDTAYFHEKVDPEKEATRHDLIAAAGSPKTIFTLPSREGQCVKLFKQHWPDARIVGVEKQETTATFGRENLCDIQKLIHPDDFLFVPGGIIGYVEQRPKFDYPMFDLAFLDATQNPTKVACESLAGFIRQYMEPGGVVGIVLTKRIAKKMERAEVESYLGGKVSLETVDAMFQRLCGPMDLLDISRAYRRGIMLFLAYRVPVGKQKDGA